MTTARQGMDMLVANLIAAGWRVLDGPWPNSLEEEAKWDFCRVRTTITPMSEKAAKAKLREFLPTTTSI